MSPDDPRHGTPTGYRAHQKTDQAPCAPCRDSMLRYQKRRHLDMARGDRYTTPSLGYIRRIQALGALGWRQVDIAEAGSIPHKTIVEMSARKPGRVHRSTAAGLDLAYARLSMKRGPSSRTALHAARNGWPPPLAWDDIDDPNERPRGVRQEEPA